MAVALPAFRAHGELPVLFPGSDQPVESGTRAAVQSLCFKPRAGGGVWDGDGSIIWSCNNPGAAGPALISVRFSQAGGALAALVLQAGVVGITIIWGDVVLGLSRGAECQDEPGVSSR